VYFAELILPPRAELVEKRLLVDVLKSTDIVLEVGSRTGEGTRFISSIVEAGEVLSIEPNPLSFSILRHRVRRLSNVRVFLLAASDTNKHGRLWFSYAGDGDASLIHRYRKHSARVQLATVDNFLIYLKEPLVDVMVVDVEGEEFRVLEGSRRVLEHIRVLIVEIHHYTGTGLQSRIENYVSQFGLKLAKCVEEDPLRISVCLWQRQSSDL
jgi:FkbM family methyltransferase